MATTGYIDTPRHLIAVMDRSYNFARPFICGDSGAIDGIPVALGFGVAA